MEGFKVSLLKLSPMGVVLPLINLPQSGQDLSFPKNIIDLLVMFCSLVLLCFDDE